MALDHASLFLSPTPDFLAVACGVLSTCRMAGYAGGGGMHSDALVTALSHWGTEMEAPMATVG